jgi:hypothetical protein
MISDDKRRSLHPEVVAEYDRRMEANPAGCNRPWGSVNKGALSPRSAWCARPGTHKGLCMTAETYDRYRAHSRDRQRKSRSARNG